MEPAPGAFPPSMSNPPTYFLKRAEAELGPFTIAQVNRMKHRREITADMPCRPTAATVYRRLDEVLPHLKDQAPPDPAKMAKIKEAIAGQENDYLLKISFIAPVLFWAPFYVGVIACGTAIGLGGVLVFKHRKLIGLVPILLGIGGLMLRFGHFFIPR